MKSHHKKPELNPLDEIVQFRISKQDKQNLIQAATIMGLKYTTYARQFLMQEVNETLKNASNENLMILNEEEWNRFSEILEAPARMNKNLKNTFKKFQKKYGK